MLFEPQTAELRPLLRALDEFAREELYPCLLYTSDAADE